MRSAAPTSGPRRPIFLIMLGICRKLVDCPLVLSYRCSFVDRIRAHSNPIQAALNGLECGLNGGDQYSLNAVECEEYVIPWDLAIVLSQNGQI